MYLMKNAVKNIGRYKSTYALFFGLYLILICASILCINIFFFAQQTAPFVQRYFNSAVSVVPANFHGSMNVFSYNEYMYIATLPFVDDIKFHSFAFSPSHLFIDFHGDTTWNKTFSADEVAWVGYDGEVKHDGYNLLRSMIIAGFNNDISHIIDINNIEGRLFENNNEVIVFNNFMRGYYFEIGDIITFDKDDFHVAFTVVGIINEMETDHVFVLLLTSFNTAEKFNIFPQHSQSTILNTSRDLRVSTGYDATIFLRDANNFYMLRDAVQWHTDGAHSIVRRYRTAHIEQNDLIIALVQSSTLIVVVVVAFIVSITAFASIIIINSRKYDIAILRAIGMGKTKIILGYLIEHLVFIWGIFVIAALLCFAFLHLFLSPWLFSQFIVALDISVLYTMIPSLMGNFLLISCTAVLSVVISSGFILSIQPLKLLCNRD